MLPMRYHPHLLQGDTAAELDPLGGLQCFAAPYHKRLDVGPRQRETVLSNHLVARFQLTRGRPLSLKYRVTVTGQ